MFTLHGNTNATGKTARTIDEALSIARRHICIMPAREAEVRKRLTLGASEASIVYGFAEIHIVRTPRAA